MIRLPAALRAALPAGLLVALLGCGKDRDAGAAPRKAESTAGQAGRAEASAAPVVDEQVIAKIAPFTLDGVEPILWEDTTLFANPVESESLMDSLRTFWRSGLGADTVLRIGEEHDSLFRLASESLDFRDCDGNEGYTTLDGGKMDKDLLVSYPPQPGFTYRLAGRGGELLPLPLRMDSMQAVVYLQLDQDTTTAPLWRIATGQPAADAAIGALRGLALVIGSRQPLRNVPIRPAPLPDSLKLLCLNSLVPDPYLLSLLRGASFYSAGSEGGKQRFIVSLWLSNSMSEMFAVDVVEGRCEVLFRLNSYEPGSLLNMISLTGSPLADVFFVRIYESKYAILRQGGRWITFGVATTDRFNTGC